MAFPRASPPMRANWLHARGDSSTRDRSSTKRSKRRGTSGMITAYNPRRMPLVTLTTFRTAHDAQLAKAVLDDEGVPSVIGDENITSIAPYMSPLGVKLQVNADDAERAEAILNRIAGLDVAEQATASAQHAIR